MSSFTLRLKNNEDLESPYLHIDDLHQHSPNLQHSSRSPDSAWFHWQMQKSEWPFFGLALDLLSAEWWSREPGLAVQDHQWSGTSLHLASRFANPMYSGKVLVWLGKDGDRDIYVISGKSRFKPSVSNWENVPFHSQKRVQTCKPAGSLQKYWILNCIGCSPENQGQDLSNPGECSALSITMCKKQGKICFPVEDPPGPSGESCWAGLAVTWVTDWAECSQSMVNGDWPCPAAHS